MEQPKIGTNFEYNGTSFYFDAEDVECMERYAKAAEKFEAASHEMDAEDNGGTALDAKVAKMKKYCQYIRSLFDDIFGDGAGIAICDERMNTRTHTEAYAAFIDFAYAQAEEGMSERTSVANLFISRAEKRRNEMKKK